MVVSTIDEVETTDTLMQVHCQERAACSMIRAKLTALVVHPRNTFTEPPRALSLKAHCAQARSVEGPPPGVFVQSIGPSSAQVACAVRKKMQRSVDHIRTTFESNKRTGDPNKLRN